jgi:hypothetical protein
MVGAEGCLHDANAISADVISANAINANAIVQ